MRVTDSADPQIPTSTTTPALDAARRLMAAALRADLPADPPRDVPADPPTDLPADLPADLRGEATPEGEMDHRLTVAEALAVLDGVNPPYPPLPDRLPAVRSAGQARREALAHLQVALEETTSVRDLTRIGLAALVLRRGGGALT